MELKITTLIIEITDKCNLNCKHCFNRKLHSYKELTLYEIEHIVNSVKMYGLQRIYLTGGEPLLHENIINILKYLIDRYPKLEIGVTTNGILLTEKMLYEIEKCGNVVIQISVDGSYKEVYEKIRGNNKYDQFENGFNVLKNSKIPKKTARTCISAINYKDVGNIYHKCVEAKIEPSFLFVSSSGNAIENWEELSLSNAQKLYTIDKINLLNKKMGLKISAPMPTYDCNFTKMIDLPSENFGRWGLTVKINGDVVCCQFLYDYPIGNIFKNTLEEIFSGQTFKDFINKAQTRKENMLTSSQCKNCKIKDVCGLGCIGLSIENGGINCHDGGCDYRILYSIFKGNNFIN